MGNRYFVSVALNDFIVGHHCDHFTIRANDDDLVATFLTYFHFSHLPFKIPHKNTPLPFQQVVLLLADIFFSCLFQAHAVCAALKLRIVVLNVVVLPATNRADFKFAVRRQTEFTAARAFFVLSHELFGRYTSDFGQAEPD